MSKNTLCWTDIPVNDLDRAIAFYTEVLGATVSKQEMEGYAFGLLPHSEENVSGCLLKSEESEPSLTGPLIYLSVDGRLDAAIAAVENTGGQVLKEKHPIGPFGFRAVIVDTEGNRLALHSATA